MKAKKNDRNNTAKETVVEKKSFDWNLVLLFVLAFFVYGWTINFGYNLDDDYIKNSLIKINNNWNGISTVFFQSFGKYDYRPVTILSFWLESLLSDGLKPSFSHFINVLLFGFLLINCYRFLLLCNFFSSPKTNTYFALGVALLFLVHPSHVSVVANIKSRDNLLSMLFGVMSSIQLLLFLRKKNWLSLFIAFVFLLLAYLSKADSYVFALLPVIYWMVYEMNKTNWKKTIGVIAFSIFLFNIISIIKSALLTNVFAGEMANRVFVDSPLVYTDSFIDKISFSLTTLFYYIKFMFVPFGYYFYYGYNQIELVSIFHWQNILAIVAVVAAFGFSIYQFKKNKIYLFAVLFFGASLLYALNLVVVVSGVVMDRYSFIASFAFAIFIVALFIDFFQNSLFKNYLFIGLLLVFAGFTNNRTVDWENKFTLYSADIPHLEKSAHANHLMGAWYINSALYDKLPKEKADEYMHTGEKYIDKSLAISPNVGTPLEAKGICLLYYNQFAAAKPYFQKALALDSNFITSANYLGFTYQNMQQIDSAAYWYMYVIKKEENFGYAANNYLKLLDNIGDKEKKAAVLRFMQTRWPNDQNLKKQFNIF